MNSKLTVVRWDEAYRNGRYATDPPIPFVMKIAAMVTEDESVRQGVGLYVGCGNGRNYLPLVDAGLNLDGLDLSQEAVTQLVARRPSLGARVRCGDFLSLVGEQRFDYLIAIQVFQHGNEEVVAAYFAQVAKVLKPGGLFFLRVNSASTEIYHHHEVVEENQWGGFTIAYGEGPKRGLLVQFYSAEELVVRMRPFFTLVEGPQDVNLHAIMYQDFAANLHHRFAANLYQSFAAKVYQ